jgi:hypothetical protein
MRKSFLLTIAILSAFFLFFLSPRSFAATLVEGEADSLKTLMYTKQLDGRPVLLFSDQVKTENLNILDRIDSIVLLDSSWRDLAVEFGSRAEITGLGGRVSLPEAGNYEIFTRWTEGNAGGPAEVKINNEKVLLSDKWHRASEKYVKLGQRKLRAGRADIAIKTNDQNSKILLVSMRQRVRAEKLLRQKMKLLKTSYIFSKDSEFYLPKRTNFSLKMRIVEDLSELGEDPAQVSAAGPRVEIDGQTLVVDEYEKFEGNKSNITWCELGSLDLQPGRHDLKLFQGDHLKPDLAILQPNEREKEKESSPRLIFAKVNASKYLVRVTQARGPFWLVFSESFNGGWRLFKLRDREEDSPADFGEIVANYPRFKVKEAGHAVPLTPKDIRYLLRPADVKDHYVVNTYANGWYVDPRKLGLGEDFILVLYFWPQSLFYIGLVISGLTLLGCLGYLVWDRRRRKAVGSSQMAVNGRKKVDRGNTRV